MIDQINLQHVLFLDIETVPSVYRFEDLSPEAAALFEQKERYRLESGKVSTAEHYTQRAGILSEFGKVICVSVGYFVHSSNGQEFRIKSFVDASEKDLLSGLFHLITQHFSNFLICGHNIKEFDVPYLCRRGIIHGLSLPAPLQLFGKKPWEVQMLDTMDMWRFGDFKHYTSLSLLAHVLGVPTPKDDIDGSQVASVYYEDNDIDRIRIYCQKDVLTTARVLQKMMGKAPVEDELVVFATGG